MTPRPSAPMLLGVNLPGREAELSPELRELAGGLRRELAPLLERPFPVPEHKAQLTRLGGRCAADGAALTFDPWLPHLHRCPRCGERYRGAEHDAWWAMGAQLWCAERAVHAALLGGMNHDTEMYALSGRMLEAFAGRYAHYPNRDNALGPTRPFFSTYLESVWLLNATLALHTLRAAAVEQAACDRFRSAVVVPSRALIASFPEGMSNRQAWHTAAQLAAAIALDDRAAIGPLVDGPVGIATLLARGLLDDGTWFEGENYHLFAHRGLWYGVALLESLGHQLPEALASRFALGFRTPFLGVLPDDTFPSRRDSRYGVSVHQLRFAEWCELGLARGDDAVLEMWRDRLYDTAIPVGDTGRTRSTADIERDEPACRLSRQALGWRTLLMARPAPTERAVSRVHHPRTPRNKDAKHTGHVESQQRAEPGSAGVLLPAQGLAVLRADRGALYVSLECGSGTGGHGHPDALSLSIQDGARRVLEDPGTGSYVERTLHWYRSTLAHNAPLVEARSQRGAVARVLEFDAAASGGMISAHMVDPSTSAALERTVRLDDTLVLDLLQWSAPAPVTVDLPVHVERADAQGAQWRAADPAGSNGVEDGFGFLEQVERTSLGPGAVVELGTTHTDAVRGWYMMPTGGELWRAIAPGPPGYPPRRFHWLRRVGGAGAVLGVWCLRGAVRSVIATRAEPPSGAAAQPSTETRPSLHILLEGGAERILELVGPAVPDGIRSATQVALSPGAPATTVAPTPARHGAGVSHPNLDVPGVLVVSPEQPFKAVLGRAHYRGSDASWEQAGWPTAVVGLRLDGGMLELSVLARTGDVVTPVADATNPFDNERADVNADGVQCYVGVAGASQWTQAWLFVPDRSTGLVRQTCLVGAREPIMTAWAPTPDGWSLTVRLAVDQLPHDGRAPLGFDLIVNERPPSHARRRGQLVLSGASGEFVYLRGDRHDPRRALPLHLSNANLAR